VTLSHTDLLQLILMDGHWHSTSEILRRHPMMVHSRVSDLRHKRGLEIQHRTVGAGAPGSEYRLIPSLKAADNSWPGSAALSERDQTVANPRRSLSSGGESAPTTAAVGPAAQLSLDEAAA
jgi:hypothetical protein